MKVVAITMVRNEADVIEAFVRHHAEIADALVVVDHRSADGTPEILRELAGEGLPLEVRFEDSRVHRQNLVMTALMREMAAGGADWILPLDADEFLLGLGGDPRSSLEALASDRPWSVDMRLYVPAPDDPPEERNVLRRIRYHRPEPPNTWTRKALVPAGPAADPRFTLSQGNHGLKEGDEFVPADPVEGLTLAHFPVRSERQIARKILGGWPAHVARPDRPPNGAWQWKRAFTLLSSGRPLTDRELRELAWDYATQEPDGEPELVLAPVPVSFELRHPAAPGPEPIEVLAETAVELAEELSQVLRER